MPASHPAVMQGPTANTNIQGAPAQHTAPSTLPGTGQAVRDMRKVFKLPVLNRSSEKAEEGFPGFVGSCRRVIHLPELSVEK